MNRKIAVQIRTRKNLDNDLLLYPASERQVIKLLM